MTLARALPVFALLLVGARRRNALVVVGAGIALSRIVRRMRRGLFNP